MILIDPEERTTVRQALKGFYDLIMDNLVKDFDIYGWNLVFPLVEDELKTEETIGIITAASSSTEFPPIEDVPLKQ